MATNLDPFHVRGSPRGVRTRQARPQWSGAHPIRSSTGRSGTRGGDGGDGGDGDGGDDDDDDDPRLRGDGTELVKGRWPFGCIRGRPRGLLEAALKGGGAMATTNPIPLRGIETESKVRARPSRPWRDSPSASSAKRRKTTRRRARRTNQGYRRFMAERVDTVLASVWMPGMTADIGGTASFPDAIAERRTTKICDASSPASEVLLAASAGAPEAENALWGTRPAERRRLAAGFLRAALASCAGRSHAFTRDHSAS